MQCCPKLTTCTPYAHMDAMCWHFYLYDNLRNPLDSYSHDFMLKVPCESEQSWTTNSFHPLGPWLIFLFIIHPQNHGELVSLKSPVLELFFLVKYVELGHSETITTRLQIIGVAVGVYFFSFPLNFRIADIKMAP